MTRLARRRTTFALGAALVATVAVGCSGRSDSSPEGAFKAFAAALAASRDDSDQMEKVYDLLSAADRRVLSRRAEAAKRLGGEGRTGAEMLVLGRAHVDWTPRKVAVRRRTGGRAELVVTGPDKQRTAVVMVREQEGWRVSLGLAAAE